MSKTPRGRKVKIAESIEHHRNVNVRLAATFLMNALAYAKNGEVHEMLSAIRCAENFANCVNPFDANLSKEFPSNV